MYLALELVLSEPAYLHKLSLKDVLRALLCSKYTYAALVSDARVELRPFVHSTQHKAMELAGDISELIGNIPAAVICGLTQCLHEEGRLSAVMQAPPLLLAKAASEGIVPVMEPMWAYSDHHKRAYALAVASREVQPFFRGMLCERYWRGMFQHNLSFYVVAALNSGWLDMVELRRIFDDACIRVTVERDYVLYYLALTIRHASTELPPGAMGLHRRHEGHVFRRIQHNACRVYFDIIDDAICRYESGWRAIAWAAERWDLGWFQIMYPRMCTTPVHFERLCVMLVTEKREEAFRYVLEAGSTCTELPHPMADTLCSGAGDVWAAKLLLDIVGVQCFVVPVSNTCVALQDACKRGDLEMATMLVDKLPLAYQEWRDAKDNTYAHIAAAARQGQYAQVMRLFPSAHMTAQNRAGETPGSILVQDNGQPVWTRSVRQCCR